ncbi:MAG: glucokinase [Ignavibacteria bacterium]
MFLRLVDRPPTWSLIFKATGRVCLGGSIPIENVSLMKSKIFLSSFLNKGRLSYLSETPVYIINDRYSVKGAAYFADTEPE